MSDDDDASERQFRNESLVNKIVESLLQPVGEIYRQSLTGLWLGNGGASIAVLSFIGASWKNGNFPRQALWPLTFFVVGLISMGIGTVVYLFTEGRLIRSVEPATDLLRIPSASVKRPTEKAGLTFKDWRTRMAILSAGLFVVGCIVGLAQLWMANP
jgi:hypothetical protein